MANEVVVHTCCRCGHKWAQRGGKEPKYCPSQHCHSPMWGEEKEKKMATA